MASLPLVEIPPRSIRRNAIPGHRPAAPRGPSVDITRLIPSHDAENIPLSSKSSIQSMLKSTTEYGDASQFSAKPFRQPRQAMVSDPVLASGRGATSTGTTRSFTTKTTTGSVPSFSNNSLHGVAIHPGPVSSARSLTSDQSRCATGISSESYPVRRPENVQDPAGHQIHSLQSNSRTAHHEIYAIAGRPRSPFPYPTRLKRPGFRSASPSTCAITSVHQNSRPASPKSIHSFSLASSSRISDFKRPSHSYRHAQNSHGHETPCSQEAGSSILANSKPPHALRNVSSSPSFLPRTVDNDLIPRLESSLSSSERTPPLYYDYSEDFGQDEDNSNVRSSQNVNAQNRALSALTEDGDPENLTCAFRSDSLDKDMCIKFDSVINEARTCSSSTSLALPTAGSDEVGLESRQVLNNCEWSDNVDQRASTTNASSRLGFRESSSRNMKEVQLSDRLDLLEIPGQPIPQAQDSSISIDATTSSIPASQTASKNLLKRRPTPYHGLRPDRILDALRPNKFVYISEEITPRTFPKENQLGSEKDRSRDLIVPSPVSSFTCGLDGPSQASGIETQKIREQKEPRPTSSDTEILSPTPERSFCTLPRYHRYSRILQLDEASQSPPLSPSLSSELEHQIDGLSALGILPEHDESTKSSNDSGSKQDLTTGLLQIFGPDASRSNSRVNSRISMLVSTLIDLKRPNESIISQTGLSTSSCEDAQITPEASIPTARAASHRHRRAQIISLQSGPTLRLDAISGTKSFTVTSIEPPRCSDVVELPFAFAPLRSRESKAWTMCSRPTLEESKGLPGEATGALEVQEKETKINGPNPNHIRLSCASTATSRPWNYDANYPWNGRAPDLRMTMLEISSSTNSQTEDTVPRFQMTLQRASSSTIQTDGPKSFDGTVSSIIESDGTPELQPSSQGLRLSVRSSALNDRTNQFDTSSDTIRTLFLQSPSRSRLINRPSQASLSPAINYLTPLAAIDAQSFFSDDSSPAHLRSGFRKRLSDFRARYSQALPVIPLRTGSYHGVASPVIEHERSPNIAVPGRAKERHQKGKSCRVLTHISCMTWRSPRSWRFCPHQPQSKRT